MITVTQMHIVKSRDKRQLNETRLCYIYFTGCCVWTQTFILRFNTLHLLQLPWAGVKLNHSSCVCSMVPRPHRSRRRGTRTGWTEKRARRTPAYDSENWLHVTRRWQWVTFLSYHRFIASALYRWEPVDAPLGIRCFSAARVPPQPATKFWHCSPSTVRKNSSGSNLTLSNGRRFEFPLWDTGTSWETTTI